VDELLAGLEPSRLDLAVEIAALAETIKGYGPIKEAALLRYRARLKPLRARWADVAPQTSATERAASAA
ncbi:MAG: DUF6537 domain-containing protein, partial [Gammaproteobacteria bacterium]|nr:DUF6537 domain-containing protein [Gammaproteobacteria bacterium]